MDQKPSHTRPSQTANTVIDHTIDAYRPSAIALRVETAGAPKYILEYSRQ